MKRVCILLFTLITCASAFASDSKVVVSINPVHSLVASVLDGIQTPELLIKGTDSVHGYQVKPSDAKLLENADVIVWIGPTFESTLSPSISNVSEHTTVIEVGELNGLRLYENREHADEHADEHGDEHGDEHEDHHAEEGHHDEHDDHHDEKGHDDGHEDHHAEEGHDHGDEDHHDDKEMDEHDDHHGHGDHHDHGLYDMHVWLDVYNAKVIVHEVTEILADLYPDHKSRLMSNMNSTVKKLDALEEELNELSKSFSGLPYLVFHDAYQYLEKMLGFQNSGTIAINPELAPGAKRILELRERIERVGALCVFKEPQFNPHLLETITEGTDLKVGTMDPLGADVPPGPDAYDEILRNLVVALKTCLG